jgi:hypothetical protein
MGLDRGDWDRRGWCRTAEIRAAGGGAHPILRGETEGEKSASDEMPVEMDEDDCAGSHQLCHVLSHTLSRHGAF